MAVELWILVRIEWADVRDSSVWVILIASLFPLSTLLFLKLFTVNPTHAAMVRLITSPRSRPPGGPIAACPATVGVLHSQ